MIDYDPVKRVNFLKQENVITNRTTNSESSARYIIFQFISCLFLELKLKLIVQVTRKTGQRFVLPFDNSTKLLQKYRAITNSKYINHWHT